MLQPGAELVLTIEKPAAGGRMIARHQGEVVLVSGTLPGEVVRARVERTGRGVAHAATVEVVQASGDRRSVVADPRCGGNVYAHIRYERQLELKSAVVADAFSRIAHLPLAAPVPIAPSPEQGYRMRARLHVRGGAIGFFREGTHDLCEPASTGQLLPATATLLATLSHRLGGQGLGGVRTLELAENIAASERALHLEVEQPLGSPAIAPLFDELDVRGVSLTLAGSRDTVVVQGTPHVADTLAVPSPDGATAPVVLRRHARAFFQANRFLLPALVSRVVSLVPAGPVLDLYAGVGLFAVSLAAAGRAPVTAVEGDWISAADLRENAAPYRDTLSTRLVPVERYLADGPERVTTLVVDPPRSGMTREAVGGIRALGPERIVFVSCDVATLARDVRRLIDAGYDLLSLEAFDLFPNTAHVEAVAVLATPAGTPR